MKRVIAVFLALVLAAGSFPHVGAEPTSPPEKEIVVISGGSVEVDVDFSTKSIAVVADLEFSNHGKTVSELALHLNPDFRDIQVSMDGENRPFQRLGSEILIPCGTFKKGESLRVRIEYSGTINDYDPVHRRTWNGITEQCVYANAYYWLPITRAGSYPRGELTVRVPRGAIAAIVGSSQYKASETSEVWTFKEGTWYPFLLAGYYDMYQSSHRGISLRVLTFKDGGERAQQYLAETKRVLDYYGERFGEYDSPILAIAEIPNQHGGGQAMSPLFVMVPQLTEISWNNDKQRLQSHELAHHWWGRRAWMYGPENVWSREAFATYSASLYLGHVNGTEALLQDMAMYEQQYWQAIAEHTDMPIVEASREQPHYHAIVYEKGALVLRMLHYLLGDDSFFELMQYYYQMGRGHDRAFQFTCDDFQQKAEELYGSDLDWFFEQWLQSTASLDIELSDVQVNEINGKYIVTATLKNHGDATMPFIDVGLKTAGGIELQKLPLGKGTMQSVRLESPKPVYQLVVDPNHYLLLPDREDLSVQLAAGGLLNQYHLNVRSGKNSTVFTASFKYTNVSDQPVQSINLHLPAQCNDIEITADGSSAPYVVQELSDGELQLTLDLTSPLAPGRESSIVIDYVLPAKQFGVDGRPWYPHLPEKSSVRATITVAALPGEEVFGTGERISEADVLTLITRHESIPLLVIDGNRKWSHAAALDGRVNVYSSGKSAGDIANRIAVEFANMEKAFGRYPYQELNVVIGAEAELSQPGTIAFSRLEHDKLIEELVRQWWGHYLKGSGLASCFVDSVAHYAGEVQWSESSDLKRHKRWPDEGFSQQHKESYLQWMLINGLPDYQQFLRSLLAEHGGAIITDEDLLAVWPVKNANTSAVLQQWLGSDQVPRPGAIAIVADRVYQSDGEKVRVISVLNTGELLLPAAGVVLNNQMATAQFEGRVAHVVFHGQGTEGSPQIAAEWMPHDTLKSLWLKHIKTSVLFYPGVILSIILLVILLIYVIVMRKLDKAIDEKEFDFSKIL